MLWAHLSANRGRDRHSSGLIVAFASPYARVLIFIVVSSPPLIPRPKVHQKSVLRPEALFPPGSRPKAQNAQILHSPDIPSYMLSNLGAGFCVESMNDGYAPEAVVPPTRSIAIAPPRSFCAKGSVAWRNERARVAARYVETACA